MIEKTILLDMIQFEADMRTSDKFLQLVEKEHSDYNTNGTTVVKLLQESILEVFDIDVTDENLYWFRNPEIFYPDEPKFKDIPIQKKFNIIHNGQFMTGDFIPKPVFEVLDVNGSKITLYSEKSIIVGGSVS